MYYGEDYLDKLFSAVYYTPSSAEEAHSQIQKGHLKGKSNIDKDKNKLKKSGSDAASKSRFVDKIRQQSKSNRVNPSNVPTHIRPLTAPVENEQNT